MSCRSTQLAVLFLAFVGGASASLSSWDETQLQLLEQYSTPLRWYNVEGAPYWVSGPKPHHRFGSGLHFISLQPGEEVTLRAAANTWLRLTGDTNVSTEDLEISVSSDARAFTVVNPIRTSDINSLLIALPEDKPSLVRLLRPQHAKAKLIFNAFFSVEEPFNALAPYRDKIRLPGKAVRLRRDDEGMSRKAWLVKPKPGIEFTLEGPARVELVARLPWPTNEPQREQLLEMRLKLDDADPLPIFFEPELDARHRTRVKRSTELMSYRMNSFFEIPEGKYLLRLQPSDPVFLSAFLQPDPDFLFPKLNGPATNAPQTDPDALPNEATLASTNSAFVDQEQAAWRLARDNNPLDAGGQAADWLNRLSETRRDYPAARETAAALWRQRMFYREVLPTAGPGDQPVQQILFSPTRLRELFEPEKPIAVYNPTVEQASESLTAGCFASVPLASSPLLYQLPSRSFDSKLRIATMINSNHARIEFFVQFNQEKPIKVILDPKNTLPATEFEPSTALATLRVLGQVAQLPANQKMGEPVGGFDLPLPISEPAIIELSLPEHAHEVHIFQEPPAKPVTVSIAYRASKPFDLAEEDYLSLLNETNPEDVLQMLAAPQVPDTNAPEPMRRLQNHFLPLARLLNAHRLDFINSIDLNSVPPQTNSVLSSEATAQLKETAGVLEKEGQTIEAIETWNRLFWEGTESNRSEAALALMNNLESLGENFLATQYARYVLMTAPDSEVSTQAIAFLESNARQAGDMQQLEQLRAFLFTRCPCPRHLADLIEAFALNSRDEMVLYAGWLLPREQRPNKLMLTAALHFNWWRTFDGLIEELPDTEAKSFWRAQKQLAFYHFAEAEAELKQSGASGVEMLRALQEGMRIRERFGATNLNERLDAIFAWEQWQTNQPGPTTWRDAENLVSQFPGAELAFNSEQNKFAPYFRTEPGKAVTLRFVGPAHLQIEARPLLDSPFEKPVDDWLDISEYGITNRVPVFQCVPNPGLQLIGASNALVGVKTLTELEWGPGLHEVAVGLAGRSGLIRVSQEEPELPTRILPLLNTHRLNLVLSAKNDSLETDAGKVGQDRGVWWVSPELARPNTRAIVEKPNDVLKYNLSARDLTASQRLRLALRMDGALESSTNFSSQELQALPLSEQWLAARRWKHFNNFTNWNALPEIDYANYLLFTHRTRQLLDSQLPHEIFQRLLTLLRVAEEFPGARKEAQCLGELLGTQTNCPPECKKILLRLTQDLAWVPLPVSPSSAGIRPIEARADLPQDPSTRRRRALLPPAETNEFTIAGQNAFTASMTLQHPADVEIHATLAKVGFSPLTPFTVSLQVDALAVQHLPLTSALPIAGTNFTLAAGQHVVRIWIEDPVVNQFARISFAGQSEGITNSIWSQSLAEAASENRFFHAATTAQPIRFFWKGPALLRLDEWRDGRFSSEFRWVEPGEQSVEIRPVAGRTESWYRIFVRATDTNQFSAHSTWTGRKLEEIPPPELQLPESVAPSEARVMDYYPLGGQEDGTWSTGLRFVRRKPFELAPGEDPVVNQFVQIGTTYRKLKPSGPTWFSTEALARVHQPGDLTLGLAERIEARPQDSLFSWDWSTEAFVGTVGSDIHSAFHTAFEFGRRYHPTRKLEYYPFIGVFAHYLSLDRESATNYTYIDQDLFTRYRSDHKWGWKLGNELEYQPWLDTRIKGYLEASSKEDFSLDHWGVGLSWNQLFGPLRAELGYGLREYFQTPKTFFFTPSVPAQVFRQSVAAGVFAERWLNGQHRIEFGLQVRHDWPDSGNSFFVVLKWDFSHGRGYQDYSPQEIVFRDLRSRNIPPAFNNFFRPGP